MISEVIGATIISEKVLDFSVDLIFSGLKNAIIKKYTIKTIIDLKDIENNGKIESIEQYVLYDVKKTIKKAFHKNQTQKTIKEILVNTENHNAFCEYLIRQGEIRTEKNDEDGYSTLIKLFVEKLYKDETLLELIQLLNEEQLKLIQIKSSNASVEILNKLSNDLEILKNDNKMFKQEFQDIKQALNNFGYKKRNQNETESYVLQPAEIELRAAFIQCTIDFEIIYFLEKSDLPSKFAYDIKNLDAFTDNVGNLLRKFPFLMSSPCYINIEEFMENLEKYSNLLDPYSEYTEFYILINNKFDDIIDTDAVYESKLKALKSYKTICYL